MDIAKYFERELEVETAYQPQQQKKKFNRPSAPSTEFDPRLLTVEQASPLDLDQLRGYAQGCDVELKSLDTEQVRHVMFFWVTGQRKLAHKYATNSRFENLKRLST